MTIATNGQICFGVLFEEGYEFPWNVEQFDNEIENWWIYHVHGFKHSVQIFDENGNYLNNRKASELELSQYYQERDEFEKTIPPVPATVVNVCSNSHPIYVLAVPSTVMLSHRGYPGEFDPSALVVTDGERDALMKFCANFGFKAAKKEPEWLLSSYWGM